MWSAGAKGAINVKKIVVSLVLVCTFLSAALAKKPKTEFDKTVDFAQYKTYAWVQGQPASNPIAHQFLIAAANAELGKLGLQQIENPDAADLLVRYDAQVGHLTSSSAIDPTYSASGGMPTPNAGMSNIWNQGSVVTSVAEGSLVILVLDRVRQKVVWSSSVKENMEQKSSKRIAQINRIVEAIFATYPPGKRSK